MPIIILLKKNWDSLLAAIIGGTVILLLARHGGIGVSPDSVVYWSAATNIKLHGAVVDFNNHPVVDFPVGYPAFLSLFVWLGGKLGILGMAPILNALLFGLTIFVAGIMMARFSIPSKWHKWAVLACIAWSPCLLEVYSMLWSETLFILLTLLFMLCIHTYCRTGLKKHLLIAALLAALVPITRYAGVTILATGGLVILLNKQSPIKKRLVDALLFVLIAPSLLVINLIRNHHIGGSLTGQREKSLTPFSQNLQDAGSAFAGWLPFPQGHVIAVCMVLLILVGLLCICIKQIRRYKRLAACQGIVALFALIYILFMLFMATVSRFETLNSRFFSPVYIPLLMLGGYWLVPLYAKMKAIVIIIGVALFSCFQYGQFMANCETWDGVRDAGIPGYTEDSWKESETINFIKRDSLPFNNGHALYSNANDAVYFLTGKAASQLPHKDIPMEIQAFMLEPHCYVVWLDDGDNPDLVSKAFLLQAKKMKLLRSFNDGAIYISE